MTEDDINQRLGFLRGAEQLKDTVRNAFTRTGRTESVADHSWRLCLLAVTFADQLPQLDLLKLLKICLIHDLGEAIGGDIPAPEQDQLQPKSNQERVDFVQLIEPLPDFMRHEFLALWDEYENAASAEARAAKALDKLETILQHNQGANPEGFDYEFNMGYGKHYTDNIPLTRRIRALLDRDTAAHAARQQTS
jgi:putative hydrolases of HD superfamily